MSKRSKTNIDYFNYIEKFFVKGLIRVLILSALREGGKCGYHIYRYVNDRVKLKMSLSTVYTIVKELVDKGLITKVGNVYQLTEKGIEVLHLFTSKYRELKSIL